jgi:hypothetical protein
MSERDISHEEQIVRWAKFVRDNPDKWKAKHKDFIDSQIILARRFYERLAKTPGGKEKILEILKLKSSA